MNTCDYCRFWKKQTNQDHCPEGMCHCAKITTGGYPLESGAVFGFPAGGEHLLTGPKFGCIHHQPQ